MVKEGIQITESAARLAGLGAKNLAALLIAVMKDEGASVGKTKLKQLVKSERPLCVLQIPKDRLSDFNAEAKKYGVLYASVSEKDSKLCDIIARQDDAATLNYIVEKLGLALPEPEKNRQPPAEEKSPSERKSMPHGGTEKEGKAIKPSVKKRIENIKAKQRKTKVRVKNKEKSR